MSFILILLRMKSKSPKLSGVGRTGNVLAPFTLQKTAQMGAEAVFEVVPCLFVDAIPPAGVAAEGPSITSFPSPYIGWLFILRFLALRGPTTRSEAFQDTRFAMESALPPWLPQPFLTEVA